MIRKGTLVRLKGRKRTTKVTCRLFDVKGGVKLDKRLSGFAYWNIADLERAPKEKSHASTKTCS